MFTRAISRLTGFQYSGLHPTVLIMSGWLFIVMQLQVYHLWNPVNMQAHLLVWLITLLLASVQLKTIVKDAITSLHQVASKKHLVFGLILLATVILNICTRNADGDIGDYHLQAIRWIEEYKVVPGIGNIRRQLGNNSNWFLLNAFGGMHFLGLRSMYTINACFVLMCGLYVVPQLSQPFWLRNFFLLLYFAVVATRKYTGAVTNDVAVTGTTIILFCWFTDIALSAHKRPFELLLIVILSVSLITYKLSALPMLIFAAGVLWVMLKHQLVTIKTITILAITCLVLFIPWMIINLFHSGYLLFPIKGTDLVNVDWKMSSGIIDYEKYANLAYARAPLVDIETSRYYSFYQWFPLWIRSLDAFSGLLLSGCAFFLALMFLLLAFSRKTRQVFKDGYYGVIALTSIAALLLWFTHGPTPRFVFGYLVFINAMGVALLNAAFLNRLLYKHKYKIAGAVMVVLLSGFTYQHFSFGLLQQALVLPKPYMQPKLTIKAVDGGSINMPQPNQQ
ncbi:MAG: hypothetical protein V4658_10940, partial [Bacteroidota bacterium]